MIDAGKGKTGVFWLIDGEILAIPYSNDATEGISKLGGNYNHRLIWESVKPRGCNKPYNYYPRGRVEISNKGKPLIYMNVNIGHEYILVIMEKFNLSEMPKIHYDGSEHYKSYLD